MRFSPSRSHISSTRPFAPRRLTARRYALDHYPRRRQRLSVVLHRRARRFSRPRPRPRRCAHPRGLQSSLVR